jgi:hypothetical protein
MSDMGKGGWFLGACLIVVGCSSSGERADGSGTGIGGAPSQKTDTNPMNPHVTNMPPTSPNGPTVTIPPGGQGAGGNTGAGTTGAAGASATGAAGTPGTTGAAGMTGTTGVAGATGTTGVAGATGTTGAAGVTGSAGAPATTGAAGVTGTAGAIGAAGNTGAAGANGAAGAAGTAGVQPVQRNWPTVDCVGGPCAAPNVCVNFDFLFVACAPCGGNDQVCCPPYDAADPFLGTCDPGLVCARNPNFQSTPPTDVVTDVCQVPGMPPPADGGLNHERVKLFP